MTAEHSAATPASSERGFVIVAVLWILAALSALAVIFSVYLSNSAQALAVNDKTEMVIPYLEKAGLLPSPAPDSELGKVEKIAQAAGDRIKVAGDILDYDFFFVADDRLRYDEAAFEKRIRKPPEAAGLLRKFRDRLATIEPFDAAALDKEMQDFVGAEGIAIGQIIHALRVAVTGKAIGFGLFETLAIPRKAVNR